MGMKRVLLASASIAALMVASGAQAADLSTPPVYKASVAPPPAWTWTGFYLGGTFGAVSSRDTISNDPATFIPWLNTPITMNGTGVIGGLEAGYNWQVAQVVFGIEGDVSWSSLRKSSIEPAPGFADTLSSSLKTLGTVRGRLGWAFDRVLVYGTGGVAFADFKDQLADPFFPFTATPSSSRTGWTAGGGVEFAITDHWTAKAEYLHVGFSNKTAMDTTGIGYVFDYKDALDIGRLGINYKF